jgi:D-alanyl-D-alanine carboxypeptidase (penicillin-binding protein 5/6)
MGPDRLMRRRILLAVVLLSAVLLAWNYLRPVPAVAASSTLPVQTVIPGAAPTIPWPATGAGAIGVSGLGAIATSGDARPGPAASIAKVMTALVVLADKKLAAGDAGPSLTLSEVDVQAYESELAQQQSVVKVEAGEQLTELQALEALLIPSGNNIAETLARWDAGSVAAFVDKMNKRAVALGLAKTKFADPAGASADTVSTPSELMRLGVTAMQLPIFAQIVKLAQVQLPVAGVVYNVDAALGKDGIIGIKTGSGFNVGASFLFAASITLSNHAVTIYGCVMGQPTLAAAFAAARALVRAMQPVLVVKQILTRNQAVGAYDTPWGDHSDVLSTFDVLLVEWPGMVLRQQLVGRSLSLDQPIGPGAPAGTLHVTLGDYNLDVPLVTASGLYPAGKVWRITRLPGSNS